MKKTILICLSIFLVLVTVSCGQDQNDAGNQNTLEATNMPIAPESGIEGRVFIGPVCPVVKVGEECPDQPYQAVLTVNSSTGERIVQIQTDEDGRFKIPLEAGEYILHPESENMLPFAIEQTFIVEAGRYTQVIVSYDSGIR